MSYSSDADQEPDGPDHEPVPEDSEPTVDWRSRAGTAGLLVGNALMGLEKALFPEKRKADTEQVSDMPIDEDAPKLDYGDSGLDPLGPDEDGYWPV